MSTLPAPLSSGRARLAESRWPRALTPDRPMGEARHNDELSLADYARLLRQWWWLAAATWLLVILGVAAFTFSRAPVYTSSATVLIRTPASAQLFPLGGDDIEGRTMAAEADFLRSSSYLLEAEVAADNTDQVKVDVGNIDARVAPSVITFAARSLDPEQAAATAQAWAQTYIDMRHNLDVADVASTISTLAATESALLAERNRVALPISGIDAEIEAADDPELTADLSAQRVALVQTLNAQLQPIDTELAAVTTQLAELELMEELLANPEVSARVNAEAIVPTGPSSPQPPRNLALGAVVGMIAAVAAVIAVSSFDDRLRSTDEVEEASGLGNLAVVPLTRSRRRQLELPVGSTIEESFQRIVSAIDFGTAAGRELRVLVVTSPQAGEAKTSTTARLAMALAAQSRNVLVIGGDLRRPSLSLTLGAEAGPGLADFLTDDDLPVENCLHKIEGRPRLVIMPAGRLRDGRNPADALRSNQLEAVIEQMRGFCDHILIDSPPLLPVVDGLELASVADGVIVSLYARKSRGRSLQRALRLLDEAGTTNVLGYVLSGVPRSDDAYSATY